jgi:hypothetical protein
MSASLQESGSQCPDGDYSASAPAKKNPESRRAVYTFAAVAGAFLPPRLGALSTAEMQAARDQTGAAAPERTMAERLAAILARLPPDDAALVAELADRAALPWERRAARKAERDRLVRLAAETYADWRRTIAAKYLAAELRRAAGCPHSESNRVGLLREIIRLSGDRVIEWRSVYDILSNVADET